MDTAYRAQGTPPPRSEEQITLRRAFDAFAAFLDKQWQENRYRDQDGIAGLRSDMSLDPQGNPTDDALWFDWLEAIDRTR